MFKEKRLVFFYSISPIHMGAGTSLGVIDNPIQRERHTEFPVLAGSGLKGSLREQAEALAESNKKITQSDVVKIFGPKTDASEHAGAVSFSDGQLVAFPVRSLRQGFVYATSPIALERLKRLAVVAGIDASEWDFPEPSDEEAVVINEELLSEDRLILESYEYKNKSAADGFKKVAGWLADNALPDSEGFDFFKNKLKKHLVLLSENQFSYFVRNATVVEPHVRINDVTGTAEERGLFFTENVPPESLFVSLVMASQERKKKGDEEEYLSAIRIIEKLQDALNGTLLQVGGDATTGRGQMSVIFVNGGGEANENS